LILDRR